MAADEIQASFSAASGDRSSLPGSCRATLDTLYRHPIAHNLAWLDVVALFTRLGAVEHGPHHEISFQIGDAHRRITRAHGKDLTAEEVMLFRRMLSHAGWSPDQPAASGAPAPGGAAAPLGDLLVVIEEREARLYPLDVMATDHAAHVIRPDDPHGLLRHLHHHDQMRDEERRAAEEARYFETIARALPPKVRIVVIGHGAGHSNAAHHLTDYLARHHNEIFRQVIQEVVADVSALPAADLLEIGRRALSS